MQDCINLSLKLLADIEKIDELKVLLFHKIISFEKYFNYLSLIFKDDTKTKKGIK